MFPLLFTTMRGQVAPNATPCVTLNFIFAQATPHTCFVCDSRFGCIIAVASGNTLVQLSSRRGETVQDLASLLLVHVLQPSPLPLFTPFQPILLLRSTKRSTSLVILLLLLLLPIRVRIRIFFQRHARHDSPDSVTRIAAATLHRRQ